MSLLRALHAELLKLKRTLAFRVIFVLPLLVALIVPFTPVGASRSSGARPSSIGRAPVRRARASSAGRSPPSHTTVPCERSASMRPSTALCVV